MIIDLQRPEIIRLFDPFLETVKQVSWVLEEYYNWELANKKIIDILLQKFSKLLSRSESARKNYVELYKENFFWLVEDELVDYIWNFFFTKISLASGQVQFIDLCYGVDADLMSDDDKEKSNDLLIFSLRDVFIKVVDFLLREQIVKTNVLPKDLLLLIVDYAEVKEEKYCRL